MDTKTREALEASIKHWEENVAAETPKNASTDGDDCALCNAFRETCNGCPVMNKTGKDECCDTPWLNAHRALISWRRNCDIEARRSAWREAAQAELDFLISLRPTDAGAK